MGGGGGGRLFEAGRLLTFSAFRMGAYSRWALIRGLALIRINTVITAQVSRQRGQVFLITIVNVDSAGRVTFFPRTTFLHKTGARRNFVNETLRHRILLLRMNAKFFFVFANTV